MQNHKKVLLKLFLIIFVAITIVVFSTQKTQKVETSAVSETKQINSVVDTSNWKIYTNEKYGFEFKDPINFINKDENFSKTSRTLLELSAPGAVSDGMKGPTISLSVMDQNAGPESIKYNSEKKECWQTYDLSQLSGKELQMADDLNSQLNYEENRVNNYPTCSFHEAGTGFSYDRYYMINQSTNIVTVITFSNFEGSKFDSILSTFKFTESSVASKADATFSVSGSTLSVVRDGKVIQTLSLDKSGEFALHVDSGSNIPAFIIDKDVNFDGHNDVGVLAETGYAGVNYFYNFYIFNPNSQKLEKSAVLSDFVLSHIDPVKKQITSTYKSGPGYVTDIYQWNGSTFEIMPDTTYWKTYNDEKYGFEIKFPSNFTTENTNDNDVLSNAPTLSNVVFQSTTYEGGALIINIRDRVNGCYDTSLGSDPETVNINGVSFLKWDISKDLSTGKTFGVGSEYCVAQGALTYGLITKNTYKPGEENFKIEPIFDQILSTFKFTKSK